jgi:pilus assembly protein CpaF
MAGLQSPPGGRASEKEPGWVTRLTQTPAQGTHTPQHQELKFTLHRKLIERINLETLSTLAADQVRNGIRSAVARLLDEEKAPLSLTEKERIIEEVLNEVFGLGPLEPLLQDPTISDILVNTPNFVFVERFGKLHLTPVKFKDNPHLMRIIEKIVSRVGRRVDESSPLVDARLPDGSRVNAVVPPVAIDGPALSIRRFRTDSVQAENLVEYKSVTAGMIEFLKACVQARLNIIISGGTGAGKTTLLNILSGFIPPDERIVTIEDAAELQLRQTHVVRLETRPPNIEGNGAIPIRALVINSLRMRPDRVIVGECRGEETLDMLQAMNTGHDGSLTTIHANAPRDALNRLEVMVGMAAANMGLRAIRQQIASAVNLFVQCNRLSDGARRVTYITEVVGMEGDIITTQDIFKFERTGVTSDGKVQGKFVGNGIRPKCYEKLKTHGINLPPTLFQMQTPIN